MSHKRYAEAVGRYNPVAIRFGMEELPYDLAAYIAGEPEYLMELIQRIEEAARALNMLMVDIGEAITDNEKGQG